MGPKRTDRITPDTQSLGLSLGDELARHGVSVSPPLPKQAPLGRNAAAPPGGVSFEHAGKIVLRREKKGRGGKTVTVIAGLGWRPRQLDELARVLRKAFGCGSSVEDDTVVLQGDMTERTQRWLSERGARQVIVGN